MAEAGNSDSVSYRLSPMEQIGVILHEYDTLRDELVENVSRQQTILAIWTTLLLAFLGFISQASSSQLAVFLPTVILLLLNVEAGRQFSMLLKSRYVGILEQQINSIAKYPLLTWDHAASEYHFYKVRVKHPIEGHHVINSSWLLVGLYPILLTILLLLGLYKGGEYLYNSLKMVPLAKIAIVTGYEFLHLLILGFILFSRLVQEKKLLVVYGEIVRKLREL